MKFFGDGFFSKFDVGFVEGSSPRHDFKFQDCVPGYVMELIAGGTAGGIVKTAVALLERTKILMPGKDQWIPMSWGVEISAEDTED